MAVFRSKDNTEIIVTCNCRCMDSFHIHVDKDDPEMYSFLSYMNGNFYRDQYSVIGTLRNKLKKIIMILFNKDYYYSDVLMSREEWEQFKEWVNEQ